MPDFSAIEAQLNDCPTCGGRPHVHASPEFPSGYLYYVLCRGCRAWTGAMPSSNLASAVTAWILGNMAKGSVDPWVAEQAGV